MKFSGILTLFVVLLVAVYIADDWKQRESPSVTAARDTMRIIQVQRDTLTVTIRVYEKAKARVDTMVQTLTDTQVVIRETPTAPPETVTVRAPIVERIRTDSALLASLYVDRRLDSLWHIQDAKLPHKPPSKWGLGVTFGPGCDRYGCAVWPPSEWRVTAGVTWRP
jgi:hypothetical protein